MQRIKSSIPPWEVQAKLQPFLWRPKGKAQSHSHTTNTNKERKGNTHTQIGLSTREGQRSAAKPWELTRTHEQQERACEQSPGCTEVTDLNVPKGFPGKAEDCDRHPEYRAVTLTGHQQAATLRGRRNRGRETAPTLPTGWPWGPASSISHSGAGRWLLPSVRGATLPRQPKEQQGKRPTTAKTRALLTGRSPSTKPAWSPKVPAALYRNVTVPLLTGRCFCPESLSLSPPCTGFPFLLLLAVASRSPTHCFFFLLQPLLKNEGRH